MLSVKNLTKIYKIKGGNDTVALDHVSVDFPETGMVFLLGKSGSGKSTLLNLVGGLDFPTEGEIILKGRSSKDFSQSDFDSYRNTYIVFIFQEYNILNEFNVEQNIALAMELQGKKATKEAIDKLLEQVDIAGFAKRKPNTLSGGQKQRIAIARALIKEPNIIMADEPTGALDSKTGEQVFETLKKLSKDKLVIVVSHDKEFAKRYGDRIIELKDGKIISDRTKHMVEATNISDNVSIINENAIKINDAKKLTKKDFDELYNAIKNSEGTIFISSGENASKSMKAARISEDGRSDVFKTTEGVELKQYDGSKTKFIRSKMPLNKSIKMGLSGLKTKPVRLFFTIFLSVISFTMFGVSSTLMLYDQNHSYSRALQNSEYECEVLMKQSIGKDVYRVYDMNGNYRNESYSTTREEYFGVKEVEELNNNHFGIKYLPVTNIGYEGELNFNNINSIVDQNYYDNFGIYHLSNVSKEQFDKLNINLEGKYPENDYEILLPKSFGEMLVATKSVTKDNYLDIIDSPIEIINQRGDTFEAKITGFFDAEPIPSSFNDLKSNSGASLTSKAHSELKDKMNNYFRNSFNGVCFTTDNVYEMFRTNTYRRYIDQSYFMNVDIAEREDYLRKNLDEGAIGVYTDETVKNNIADFTLYDLDDKKIDLSQDFRINDGEMYLPASTFNHTARSIGSSLVEKVLEIVNADRYAYRMRVNNFVPTFNKYYHEHRYEVESAFNKFRDGDFSAAKDVLTLFLDEFNKAFIINWLIDEYRISDNYGNLSTDNRNLLDKLSYESSTNITSDEINEVYQILYDNFDKDDACKNYFLAYYLNRLAQYRMYGDELITNGLYDLTYKDYHSWSDTEIQNVKNFFTSNNITVIHDEYSNVQLSSLVGGFSFKEFRYIPENPFKCDQNITWYYSSSKVGKGTIKVVGYYKAGDSAYSPLFGKEYLEKIGDFDSSYSSGSQYITKYVAPIDAKYSRVMVKTDFSQEQVAHILANHTTYKYEFTSFVYQSVATVISLINMLKQVFLWIGVGFGIFSALMLLNFITVSISSKKKDIGILRAIGARKSDVFKIFFAESLFISAICSLISVIGARIVEFFMDKSFMEQTGISIISFNILSVAFVVGVALIITFIATFIPVMHSSKKPPVESIRAL